MSSRPTSLTDQIGGRDSNDFFRVRLSHRSSIDVSLNGKANLELLNSRGRSLQLGNPQGKALSAIKTTLEAGVYYIRVFSAAKQASTYRLKNAVTLAQPMDSLDHRVPNKNAAIAYPQDTPSQTAKTGVDDGSTIDILIVYTSEVRAAEGGAIAMQKTIQAAVDEVNQGYANSGIIPRLRLVHTTEVNYAESGNSDLDLARLQNKSDGYLDDVHTIRNTYGADIVSMVVKNSEAGGNSYTMNQVVPEFEAYAFSVVQIDNVKTRFSLGHEIGHNLGAAHDRTHADSDAAFADSYGYITPSGVGDVMSYAKKRLNFYASPNVTINGETLGKVNESNVVRTLNSTRFTAANWRKSVVR
ncbi:MAG TPA: M12 family metallo-peptidase [Coleofasciculaceae cyanobacterium]